MRRLPRRGDIGRALAIVAMLLGPARSAAAIDPAPVARLRIYDYAGIRGRTLAEAQRMVTDIYKEAGIETIWETAVRPDPNDDPDTRVPFDATDFSIIILGPSMPPPRTVKENTAGMAAVSQGGGRVAYVLFDQVSRLAADTSRHERDLLGLIIAHELGHLLLPPGSHSTRGLMRAQWTFRDLRTPAPDVSLSGAQARLMRAQLRARVPDFP